MSIIKIIIFDLLTPDRCGEIENKLNFFLQTKILIVLSIMELLAIPPKLEK